MQIRLELKINVAINNNDYYYNYYYKNYYYYNYYNHYIIPSGDYPISLFSQW